MCACAHARAEARSATALPEGQRPALPRCGTAAHIYMCCGVSRDLLFGHRLPHAMAQSTDQGKGPVPASNMDTSQLQHETAMHTMHQCVACLSTDTASRPAYKGCGTGQRMVKTVYHLRSTSTASRAFTDAVQVVTAVQLSTSSAVRTTAPILQGQYIIIRSRAGQGARSLH